MPGPVVKKSTRFREAVPKPLQSLYDFATDDPTGGLSPSATVLAGPSQGVLAAIKSLQRVLPKGKVWAEELLDDLNIERSADTVGQQAAIASRVTSRTPPPAKEIRLPAFAEGQLYAPRRPTTRDPIVAKAREDYNTFKQAAGLPSNPVKASSRMGALLRSEMRRGIDTPRVQQAEDLTYAAKRAPVEDAGKQKPLLRNTSSTTQTRKASLARGKLNETQVRAIRALTDEGKGFVEVAKKFKVSPATVFGIAKRQSWVWVK